MRGPWLRRCAWLATGVAIATISVAASSWFCEPRVAFGERSVKLRRGILEYERPRTVDDPRIMGHPAIANRIRTTTPFWAPCLGIALIAGWLWDVRCRDRLGIVRWLVTCPTLFVVTLWLTSGAYDLENHNYLAPGSLLVAQGQLGWYPEDFGRSPFRLCSYSRTPGWNFSLTNEIVVSDDELRFPLSIIAIPLSVIMLAAWRFAPRPIRPGQCRKCGYDLRGSVDRCPECGKLTRDHEHSARPKTEASGR